ncbi:hypothetical protein D3C80_1743220 [compost metagenome]
MRRKAWASTTSTARPLARRSCRACACRDNQSKEAGSCPTKNSGVMPGRSNVLCGTVPGVRRALCTGSTQFSARGFGALSGAGDSRAASGRGLAGTLNAARDSH